MKVYSDRSLNTLYIEAIDSGPCSDFTASRDGDRVSLYRVSQAIYEFYLIDFGIITNLMGVGFQSSDECYAYLVDLTVPQFPLRFTVRAPLVIEQNVVAIDQDFINNEIYMTDGGHY